MPVAVTDPTLTTAEAAAYIGVALATLEHWRTTGRYNLPYLKAGRAVRYRKSALDKFMASRTFASTGEYDAAQAKTTKKSARR